MKNLILAFSGFAMLMFACTDENITPIANIEDNQNRIMPIEDGGGGSGGSGGSGGGTGSTEINVTVSRVGSSGTGRDITVRDKIYIIGENSHIYRYENGSWIKEASTNGELGQRISSNQNTLFISGHDTEGSFGMQPNDKKIWWKPMGVNTAWSHLQDADGNGGWGNDIGVSRNNISGATYALAVAGLDDYIFGYYSELADDYIKYTKRNPSYSESFDVAVNANYTRIAARVKINGERAIITHGIGNYSSAWTRITTNSDEPYDLDYAPDGDLWYCTATGGLVNATENKKYKITTSGVSAYRIAISDNGKVYIVGTNNKIYKVNI
ncbi:hypothetical protein [Reichenbachiella sp.]